MYDNNNNGIYQDSDHESYRDMANEAEAKRASSSLVWGIVTLIVNLIMMCSMLMGGPFLFGGILCIGPIVGISHSATGWNSVNHGKAVAGRVCSIISLVLGIIILIVGLISRFSSINY